MTRIPFFYLCRVVVVVVVVVVTLRLAVKKINQIHNPSKDMPRWGDFRSRGYKLLSVC